MTFEFSDVAFAYRGKNRISNVVFEGLTFSISQRECVGIIGHEGAGKSTLLQLMAGLLKPDGGTIKIDGVDIWQQSNSISTLRKKIGFAFQFPEQQFFCETVSDELLYTQKNLQDNSSAGFINPEEALAALGLEVLPYLERSPYSLSMGEARRVALATLLMTKPEAMLLDEPTVGLDGAGVEMVLTLLRRLKNEGATIVVVSHDVDQLSEVASRIIIVGDGEIQEDGPVQTLLNNEELLLKYGYQLPDVVRFMKEQDGDGIKKEFYTFQEAKAWLDSARRS
jgi:energy-coupling factor transport system ATP-binding protein